MGPKHRSDIYLTSGLGWLVGYCIIPLIAYYIRDFRYMHWACVCPLVSMACWLFFISESPRWLITSGNTAKAERVLRNIVQQNGLSEENFDEKFAELLQHLQLVCDQCVRPCLMAVPRIAEQTRGPVVHILRFSPDAESPQIFADILVLMACDWFSLLWFQS